MKTPQTTELTDGERLALAIAESSRLVRWVAPLITFLRAAASGSRFLGTWRAARSHWQSTAWPARRSALGLALITAGLTAIVLNWSVVVSWLGLLVPFTVVVFGVLLLLSSLGHVSGTTL